MSIPAISSSAAILKSRVPIVILTQATITKICALCAAKSLDRGSEEENLILIVIFGIGINQP
jgi:hypothetical protein